MTQKNKTILAYGLFALFATLAVIFGIFDLQISNAIANAESPFGLTMELSGMLIAPYLFMAAGIIIADYSYKSPVRNFKVAKVALGILFAVGGFLFCGYIYYKSSFTLGRVMLCVTLLVMVGFMLFLKKKTPEQLYWVFQIAVVTVVYMLTVLIVISVIKQFWGRVRFREMIDLAQFSPWYIPQGINGHNSFPSGHTSNAATLYVITMFAPFVKKLWQKAIFYTVPILWIIIMAVSRVLVGAHFCSDVLFGAVISVALFYLCKKLVLNKMKK